MIDHRNGFVGIFWTINTPGGGIMLLTDRIPLVRAEPDGDTLTYFSGHHEFWSHLRRLGTSTLKRQGLPVAITTDEYEEWPRGRVVYNATHGGRFVIYADRKLQGNGAVDRIAAAFDIPPNSHTVISDKDYHSQKIVRGQQPDQVWRIVVPADLDRRRFYVCSARTPTEIRARLHAANVAERNRTADFVTRQLTKFAEVASTIPDDDEWLG